MSSFGFTSTVLPWKLGVLIQHSSLHADETLTEVFAAIGQAAKLFSLWRPRPNFTYTMISKTYKTRRDFPGPFREPGLANEFLRTFPRFDIPNRLEGLEHDRRELAAKVDERLRRGGFDIGKFPGEQRRGIARRFIEADEKLEDLARHGEELQLADSLRTDWMTVMENGGRSG